METIQTEILVVGSGPGGSAAALYAAALGKKVMMVEQDKRLGGVCLHRGCIPSKALLHAAKMIHEAEASAARGIQFSSPKIQIEKLRNWKASILEKLSQGIQTLSQKRNVELLTGHGYFEDSETLRVETSDGQKFVKYDKAIIAVGSKPAMPKAFDLGNPRIMTSTEALELEEIPKNLLIVGGGYIGMELGVVYAALGSKVAVVEAMDSILLGADSDLVRPVAAYAEKNFKAVHLNTKVSKMSTAGKQIKVTMEFDGKSLEGSYDRVLVAVGRAPNCGDLGLENTKVTRDEKGFIKVNTRQETADPKIMAIGDVAGGLLLAHKAHREARVAVEVLCGELSQFKEVIIPAVVFTEPEVAWCGLTENEAREKGIEVKVSRFSWAASGRAVSTDKTEGMTKLVIQPGTERILGVGIVGAGAGELISEGVHAIEMGATAEDLAKTVHPHPTLSETLMEAAEAFYGTSTSVYTPRK